MSMLMSMYEGRCLYTIGLIWVGIFRGIYWSILIE